MPCKSTIARRKQMLAFGKRLCGARLAKHPGRYCRQKAEAGHWRCHYHGAKSTGPRPRFDDEGNRIVPNLEARNAGFRRWVERRRLIRAAMKAAEPPKVPKPIEREAPKRAIIFRALSEGIPASRIIRTHDVSESYVWLVKKLYRSSSSAYPPGGSSHGSPGVSSSSSSMATVSSK